MYTDNPIADFLHHDREQARELERLQVCVECGEPIQDEMAYYFHGDWYCEECANGHRRSVDEYGG